MYQFPEKRAHDRHDRLDIVLLSDTKESFTRVILLNYSPEGLYIKSPRPLTAGEKICIKSDASLEGKVPEQCDAHVVWCSPVIGKHPHFRAGIKYEGEKKEEAE